MAVGARRPRDPHLDLDTLPGLSRASCRVRWARMTLACRPLVHLSVTTGRCSDLARPPSSGTRAISWRYVGPGARAGRLVVQLDLAAAQEQVEGGEQHRCRRRCGSQARARGLDAEGQVAEREGGPAGRTRTVSRGSTTPALGALLDRARARPSVPPAAAARPGR